MATKLFILVGTVVAIAAAVPHHKSLKRPNHDHIDYYDCTGKSVGNHVHPSDCTRYIACSTGGVASDMACAPCNQHDEGCLDQPFLHYNRSTGSCEWPATTTCVSGEDPVEEEEEVCAGRTAGASCSKDDCEHCGYCKDKMSFYFRCERTFPSDPKLEITGVWVHESCDSDLWWNPELKPTDATEGGACDRWENLSPATQAKYKSDPNCVEEEKVCEWGQDEGDACTGRYWYLDPAVDEDRQDLSCGDGLIWDPATETCRSCSNVAGCDCSENDLPVGEGKH